MDTEKEINDLKAKIGILESQNLELIKTVTAILKALKEQEEYSGDEYMAGGSYYGVNF